VYLMAYRWATVMLILVKLDHVVFWPERLLSRVKGQYEETPIRIFLVPIITLSIDPRASLASWSLKRVTAQRSTEKKTGSLIARFHPGSKLTCDLHCTGLRWSDFLGTLNRSTVTTNLCNTGCIKHS
jgi:hypothetical protein